MIVELRYKNKRLLYYLIELELLEKIEYLKCNNIPYRLYGKIQ